MADKEKDAAAEAPKKSKKMLLIIIIAAVVLLGGGGGGFFYYKSTADAAPKEPTKGIVVTMDNALTINLADGHFLKVAFTLQETADAGTEAVDNSEAIDLAILHFSGMKIAELQTDAGIEKNKEELLAKIEKAYYEKDEKKQIIMDLYFTQFVTQ